MGISNPEYSSKVLIKRGIQMGFGQIWRIKMRHKKQRSDRGVLMDEEQVFRWGPSYEGYPVEGKFCWW